MSNDNVDAMAKIDRMMRAEHDQVGIEPTYHLGDDRLKVIFSGGIQIDIVVDRDLDDGYWWGGCGADSGIVEMKVRDGLAAFAADWTAITAETVRWAILLTFEAWGAMPPAKLYGALDADPGTPFVADQIGAMADQSIISTPDDTSTWSTSPGIDARLSEAGRLEVRKRAKRYARTGGEGDGA